MTEPQLEVAESAAKSELEGLAMDVELTLASVLQGIAMAILIPKIVDLITSGVVAKLPQIPASLRFMLGYVLVGSLGYVGLQLRPEFGLSQDLGWAVIGLVAVILPAIHAAWQFRLMARRSQLIEQAKREAL